MRASHNSISYFILLFRKEVRKAWVWSGIQKALLQSTSTKQVHKRNKVMLKWLSREFGQTSQSGCTWPLEYYCVQIFIHARLTISLAFTFLPKKRTLEIKIEFVLCIKSHLLIVGPQPSQIISQKPPSKLAVVSSTFLVACHFSSVVGYWTKSTQLLTSLPCQLLQEFSFEISQHSYQSDYIFSVSHL